MATSKDERIGYWSQALPLYIGAAFATAVGLLVPIAAATSPEPAPKVLSAVVMLMTIAIISFMLRYAGEARCALTTFSVLVWTSHRQFREIPLDQVVGVAIVRWRPGWAVFVWQGDRPAVRLLGPGRVFRWKRQSTSRPDAHYWQRVATSPGGLAATAIYKQWMVANPAASSPSTTIAALLSRDGYPPANDQARYWSPNGEHKPDLADVEGQPFSR